MNSQGGVAKVTSYAPDDGYGVKYIHGGSDKNVEAEYVVDYVESPGKPSRGAGKRGGEGGRGRKSKRSRK